MKKLPALTVFAIAAVLSLTGCAAPAATQSAQSTQSAGTVIIDVRTPAEFAAGHLRSAINIDVESPTFDASVNKLAVGDTYTLYCHSGNRAAAALSRMQALGFTHLTNAGGIDQASSTTGLPVVTGP
jgi:phage shock protein E